MSNQLEQDESTLSEIILRQGLEWVERKIRESSPNSNPLSILCDTGMHRIPTELMAGDTHVFSHGMIDTLTDGTVAAHIEECCRRLASKLRSERFSEIRLFYSGHSLLPAFAKLTVYRVAHLDTIDFGFFSEAGYRRLQINLRSIAYDAQS